MSLGLLFVYVVVTVNLLGLSLPRLDAKLSDVELAAAPPVRPADVCVLFPSKLHNHQVADVDVSGEEERQGGVTVQDWPAGLKEVRYSEFSGSVWAAF